jgi:hypothetical protein
MTKDRGFKMLCGETISKVDATCINEVVLIDSGGCAYSIEAEAGPLGIPVISCKKMDADEQARHLAQSKKDKVK